MRLVIVSNAVIKGYHKFQIRPPQNILLPVTKECGNCHDPHSCLVWIPEIDKIPKDLWNHVTDETCGERKEYCGSHSCKVCKKACHAIPPCAKVNEDYDGFGAAVLCASCAATKGEAPPKRKTSEKVRIKRRGSVTSVQLEPPQTQETTCMDLDVDSDLTMVEVIEQFECQRADKVVSVSNSQEVQDDAPLEKDSNKKGESSAASQPSEPTVMPLTVARWGTSQVNAGAMEAVTNKLVIANTRAQADNTEPRCLVNTGASVSLIRREFVVGPMRPCSLKAQGISGEQL
ncbi:Hypothetical predicted protein [Paramuricea clavata]|uniref:SCAN domain-containing protein n=1 Tax=Paramuricea clavata TaxID=317549 RepID=A0A6S7GAF3_PARCT|nr:Hypothetical predicted protein [Paramuricea clavata]